MSGSARIYDVCIVGAGPSGATCAYYLAQRGKSVLLLEKKKFPRDKLCGDAVCTNAQTHLERMGVLQELEAENKGLWTRMGGLIGPEGTGFLADSSHSNGRSLVMAVKREILDEKIARAAVRAGAELKEEHEFARASLDRGEGVWTVDAQHDRAPVQFRARALVAADGALSRVTQALGIPTTPPDGICSRAYVKAGTHNFDADGVCFYTSELVPGYAALFRHADGDVNYCCYIISGGTCTIEDLHEMHHKLLREHPNVIAALGPNAQIEKMRGAPLRLGGIAKSYYDHMLIIGDAAGHIDPLTGEGIHHAMDGGEIAATTLAEALERGDLSERFLALYQRRWMKAFGWDFFWSKHMARFYARYPVLIDASVRALQRHGVNMLIKWGEIMTGLSPKRAFLSPGVVIPILVELARLKLGGARAVGEAKVQIAVNGSARPWQQRVQPARDASPAMVA